MDKLRKLVLPNWRPVFDVTRKLCCNIQVNNLLAFPLVKIDSGKLKYILAKVYVHGEMGDAKLVVRGVGRVKYHLDIYDQLQKEASKLNLCTQCMGGGNIVHDPEQNYIKIYGRSQMLGKANHDETKEILYGKYPSYKIDSESGPMGL